MPVYQHTLSNGLVLLAETMDHVRSAAFNFLVPAGAANDPPGRFGVAGVAAEMITRGAGDRDSRQLSDALDALGLDRDESVGAMNMRFWGSTLARNVPAALDIYSDIILRPHFPEEDLEPVQALAAQDIEALEDSPGSKVKVELRKRYYPSPLNQDRRGKLEDIEALTIDAVRDHHRRLFRPNGTILSVAGNIDWESLKAQVERLFGGWPRGTDAAPTPGPHTPESAHIGKDTEQTHIAIAYPSVSASHPEYFAARAVEGVLSGGMSSRLFTEVREKRGLCYSVGVGHETFRDRGSILGYAGTGPDRAQHTLDLTVAEVRRIRDGVTLDEVQRVQAGLKAMLIMQQESTSARAGAIASDWYFLGRVRSFDEIQAAIDAITPDVVVDHATRYPARTITIVTIGPKPLALPE